MHLTAAEPASTSGNAFERIVRKTVSNQETSEGCMSHGIGGAVREHMLYCFRHVADVAEKAV